MLSPALTRHDIHTFALLHWAGSEQWGRPVDRLHSVWGVRAMRRKLWQSVRQYLDKPLLVCLLCLTFADYFIVHNNLPCKCTKVHILIYVWSIEHIQIYFYTGIYRYCILAGHQFCCSVGHCAQPFETLPAFLMPWPRTPPLHTPFSLNPSAQYIPWIIQDCKSFLEYWGYKAWQSSSKRTWRG